MRNQAPDLNERVRISPELRASIELHNEANKIAKVKSRRPRAALRAEARAVRRELKHDGQMNKARRARFEQLRQLRLTADRAAIATRKCVGDILSGLPGKEKKTELGIVLPSGRQIGEVLAGVSAKRD